MKRPSIEELEAILALPNGTYEVCLNPDGSIRAEPKGYSELEKQRDLFRSLLKDALCVLNAHAVGHATQKAIEQALSKTTT